MQIASVIAESSYCKKKQVGAIIVKDYNIIAVGYNGTPPGFDNNCEDCNDKTLPETLHAESNCISKCARSHSSSDGATMYCTLSPCINCAKIIIQSGIKRFVYNEQWKDNTGLLLLKKAKIQIEILK